MTSPLLQVAWGPCLLEPGHDRALETYARRQAGLPHPAIRYFVSCPWLARAMVDLNYEHGLLLQLDWALADLISLVVSQENSCRFCYAAVRAMMRIQGMSEDRMRQLEQQLSRADLEPRSKAVVAYARRMSRSNPLLTAADAQGLHDAGLGPQEVREIAFVAASVVFLNRVASITALPTKDMEQMPEQLLTRLLRPLLARMLAAHRSRGRPTSPAAPPTALPFGFLVQRLEGSPIAGLLGRMLEGMWAPSMLTHRCKAMLFAVVARGLGCQVSEAAARQALRAEGMTDANITQLLTHLDAPGLDRAENLLAGFARETIWNEPIQLQRHARQLREQLGAEPFVEAIGVLALANALCRMAAALSPPA